MTNEQLYDYWFEHSNDPEPLPPGYRLLEIIKGSHIYRAVWATCRQMPDSRFQAWLNATMGGRMEKGKND